MPHEKKLKKWKLQAYRTWAIIGIILLLCAAGYVCGIIWMAVATVVITALLVFFMHGAVNFFERKGLPRAAGAGITYLIFFIIVFGLFAIFIPAIVDQLGAFIEQIPTYAKTLQQVASDNSGLLNGRIYNILQSNGVIEKAAEWATTTGTEIITAAAAGLLAGVKGVGTMLLVTFISLVAAFWILIDLPKISKEVRNLIGPRFENDFDIITGSFGTAIYGWAKSTLICAIINGLVVGLIFWIIGIPYSAILGFATGLFYIIPYIGPLVADVMAAAIALLAGSPLLCVLSVVINLVVHELIANLVSPRLMKSSVNVHPAITLIVILAGEAIGGVVGMLAAVPVAAAAQSIFVAYYEAKTGKSLYSEDGALFHKTPTSENAPTLADAGATLTNLKLPKNKKAGKHGK